MKKMVASIYSYVNRPVQSGETYSTIIGYFCPEFITSFLLYSALILLDDYFISNLKGTAAYSTLGVTNTLFHFVTKIADGFSVGMVILCGQYNGIGDVKQVGKAVVDAFWVTCILGGIIASVLYVSAYWIYKFYEVPESMIVLGMPFLRLRALGVFFNFVFFAFVGFLRGIKNTKVPMCFFILGALTFIFFDYALIFGKFGFMPMGLLGSALASVIQYSVMFTGLLVYILFDSEYTKFGINFFYPLQWSNIRALVALSWPVMLDKASLALCHIWLAKMVACMCKTVPANLSQNLLPSLAVINRMSSFVLLPGLACAQVITFLVSNDYKANNWPSIKNNTKKVTIFSFFLVGTLLLFFSLFPRLFIRYFDKDGIFIDFAAKAVPIINILIFFDLLQLILAAALRGAANVKTVMMVRGLVTFLIFIPLSYIFSILPIENMLIKFVLTYSAFYISNALMSIIYLKRFKHDAWKHQGDLNG